MRDVETQIPMDRELCCAAQVSTPSIGHRVRGKRSMTAVTGQELRDVDTSLGLECKMASQLLFPAKGNLTIT
jgi:hypothetical protein